MISDLDRPEVSRPASRWPLPVVTGLCVAAFMGLAVSVPSDPTVAPALASAAPERAGAAPASAPVGLTGPTHVPSPRTEFQLGSSGLGLPAPAYKSVVRVPNSTTTGLYPADEEALLQLRYRLPDDRVVVLVRVPVSDPLRGVNPASYVAGSVSVRGLEARLLSGRTAVEPTILFWVEGDRAYQLYSSVHSIRELVQLAEQLR